MNECHNTQPLRCCEFGLFDQDSSLDMLYNVECAFSDASLNAFQLGCVGRPVLFLLMLQQQIFLFVCVLGAQLSVFI